jgi:dTDP-4-amino-4,6-dideoxygalactose transaminase
MIQLFNIPNYTINTDEFSHYLHGSIVEKFEQKFLDYVGAKYACSVNSATNAIFLLFLNKNTIVNVPSLIPPVVLNALITSGNKINFTDDVNWIGDSYILHHFEDYKIIDSAQKVERDQFKEEANDPDIMFFSFYPTKPVGSSDGGIIVSNDKDKIDYLKTLSFNGMSFAENNWDRKIIMPGYKFYLNSIQAFIADKNLDILDQKKQKLKNIRDIYNSEFGLNNTSDHLYRIEVDDNKKFINVSKQNKIIHGIHYEAQHLNNVYKPYSTNSLCPNSEKISKTTVSIPFHENLSEQDLNHVIKNLKKYELSKS